LLLFTGILTGLTALYAYHKIKSMYKPGASSSIDENTAIEQMTRLIKAYSNREYDYVEIRKRIKSIGWSDNLIDSAFDKFYNRKKREVLGNKLPTGSYKIIREAFAENIIDFVRARKLCTVNDVISGIFLPRKLVDEIIHELKVHDKIKMFIRHKNVYVGVQ